MGSSARKKWTLRRTLVEVCREADSPKPPQDRGAHLGSHATDAAPTKSVIQYVASDEGLWGTSVKEHHVTIGREGVSSAVDRDLRGERGVVESSDTADEAGAMFWEREGGIGPRRDSQELGAAVRRCIRKAGRKLRRRTWATAGQSHRARRRRGNLMNSAGRGRSTELLRGAVVC